MRPFQTAGVDSTHAPVPTFASHIGCGERGSVRSYARKPEWSVRQSTPTTSVPSTMTGDDQAFPPMKSCQAMSPVSVSTARRSPASVATVSYTHLRAHETVLDLVCRLLLE